MFSIVFSTIVSAISAALNAIRAAIDYFKTDQNIETGKKIQQADTIIVNQKIQIEQSEILIQDRPKSEVVEKLEKGTF